MSSHPRGEDPGVSASGTPAVPSPAGGGRGGPARPAESAPTPVCVTTATPSAPAVSGRGNEAEITATTQEKIPAAVNVNHAF